MDIIKHINILKNIYNFLLDINDNLIYVNEIEYIDNN